VLDLSTEEKEFKNFMYPVNKLDAYDEWRMKFMEFWNYEKKRLNFGMILKIRSYKITRVIISQ
jgi:hypothetical protein